MNRGAAALLIGVLLILSCGLSSAPRAAGAFDDWAAVVVAGDFRAHSGAPSEAFDNARHDVARALVQAGFSPANIRAFSVRPERYRQEQVMLSEPSLIASQLRDLAAAAPGGCLVYFTSHGSPDGVLVGDELLSPAGMSRILDEACLGRPSVVIISACFSGVFVPALSRPDRMVLTAARPDRSSFGCGESDRYPYFDACVLQELPYGGDFGHLGVEVQRCVARKEAATGMSPPSEPQLFIGTRIRPLLPFYPLRAAAAAATLPSSSGAP